MTMRVSAVIPTWNGKALLADCLESLCRQTLLPSEIIIVDDGSTDGTDSMLASGFPDVKVLRLEANRGFCVAANEGLRTVQENWVLLLNNDMTFEPDFLERLTSATEKSEAAMLTPLILWRDAPDTIYAAGDRQLANGRPESIGFRAKREGFEFASPVFGVTAGAALYRRELFDTIGLFDERFVSYFEDSDLSFRARLAGFSAACVPESVIYHVGSASLRGLTLSRTLHCHRNHALLVLKNMPTPLLLQYAPRILAERWRQAWRVFSAARCEHGALRALGTLTAAWLEVAKIVPHALRERRRIQRKRRIPTPEIRALLQ